MKSKINIIFFILIALVYQAHGNNKNTVQRLVIKVVDTKGNLIPYSLVKLKRSKLVTYANIEGEAIIDFPNKIKEDSLIIRYTGYKEYRSLIKLPITSPIVVQLKDEFVKLNDVTIHGESGSTQLRKSTFTVSAIETKEIKGLTKDLNQTLEEIPGVKVRQNGGMGSGYNFTINGFSGSQIKFFINGIPMEFFGRSYGLNNLPVSIAERIEIYKGVIPVYLGADVLGAAVNIVTNQQKRDYLDISYQYGSFNQNQFSLLSRKHLNEHIAFTANIIGNYADNNYPVQVDIYDIKDLSFKGVQERKRFHDAYKNGATEIGISLLDLPFTDELSLKLVGSMDYKEQQTGMNMTQVAGQAFTQNKMGMATLLYRKKNFITQNLNAKTFISNNANNTMVADTSSRKYNWNGEYVKNNIGTSGELLRYKSLLTYHDRSFVNNTSFSYKLSPYQNIVLNNTYSYYRRVGTDNVNPYEIPYNEPNILNKNILGLSYEVKLFSDRWLTNILYKNYWMNLKSAEAQYSKYQEIESKYQHQGAGISSTFFVTKYFQIKASFEKTYRLPQASETLGDGLLILNNAKLKPEESNNFNFGLLWNRTINKHTLNIEGNYFYRKSNNLIRLNVDNVTSHYENLFNVEGSSYNLDFSYKLRDKFSVNLNGTYLLDINKSDRYGFYNTRIPNKPYLYGNILLSYTTAPILGNNDRVTINWNTNYVHEFYLAWPNMGLSEEKYTIPMQLSNNVSLLYQLYKNISISFSCNNLMDAQLYDNYALQKPGRSFMFKVRYFISKIR